MERTIGFMDWMKKNFRLVLAAGMTAWLIQALTQKWVTDWFAADLQVSAVYLPDSHALGAFGVSVVTAMLGLILILWIGGHLIPAEKRRWAKRRTAKTQAPKPRGARYYGPGRRAQV